MALYAEVAKLAEKDPSPVRIARQLSASHALSLSPGTIRHWIVGDRKVQRRNVFEQIPSPALSYVVGASIGDGCILIKTGCVKLQVTDLDFAQAFNLNMASLFSRVKPNKILTKPFEVERLPMYVVKYDSEQLAAFLLGPLEKPLELAFAFPHEFLRGFFDAEGHVDVASRKHFQLHVGAENSDRVLLLRIKHLLKNELDVNSRINRKRKAGSIKVIRNQEFVMRRTSFSLLIRRIVDVKRFTAEVGFTISRKTQKLEDALSILAYRGKKSRVAMWKQLYVKKRGEWVRRILTTETDKGY